MYLKVRIQNINNSHTFQFNLKMAYSCSVIRYQPVKKQWFTKKLTTWVLIFTLGWCSYFPMGTCTRIPWQNKEMYSRMLVKATTGGSVKLITTNLRNLVALERFHQKPMGVYDGLLQLAPSYIPIGLWLNCSTGTRSVNLVETSFTHPPVVALKTTLI